MSSSNPVIADAVATVGAERIRLGVTGVVIALGGLLALFAPHYAGELVIRLLGIVLLGSAVMMVVNWLLARRGEGRHRRGIFLFVIHIVVLVIAANALLFSTTFPLRLLRIVLGLLFLLDAATQGVIALQVETWTTRAALFLSAVVTGVAGLCAIFISREQAGGELLAILLGSRMLVFGIVLALVAWRTRKEDAYAYGLRPTKALEPQPGEAYAVFIGSAFHLGVFVGDNEIVDYRDDNLVHLVTWEQFLLGREPEHWQYPDLDPVSAEEVVRVAREAVGRTYPYKFVEFNCESFAIWCKSGGKTHHSVYAQIALAFGTVKVRPFVGTLLELYTRVTEWIAFHLGGTFGKRTALGIRRTSAAVAKALLARKLMDIEAAKKLPPDVTHADGS